ncbi:MAG: branched-chain amino acid aminotransferase [Cytophagales bacterium]|nr:branched-chain amino acid aminotransferase [Cytophagales bacterium]
MEEQYNIQINKTENSRIGEIDFNNLAFGRTFSDHMFVVDYENGEWGTPQIIPFQNLSFSPALISLHYGQTVFEGLKAFRDKDGVVSAFRPEEHAIRINKSAERLCLPTIPEDLFLEGLYKLLEVDNEWVPKQEGCSLYIRPLLFASEEFLGVSPTPSKCKFVIFASPVGSYYSGAIKVLVETEYVRAAEGGIGFAKAGGNYAASLLPTKQAVEKGYQQLLWTDAKEHKYIEEAGTMNIMFQIGDTLVTPATSTSILSGITRKSVVALAKKWGYKIEERKVSVDELVEAHKQGLLKDAFGTGTAATITQISHIGYNGVDYELPPVEGREFSNRASDYLQKLKDGQEEDYMNWMVKL